MKAVCFSRYGSPDVLELRTLEPPRPKDDDVLIRIHAATVTPGDCEVRSFKFPFWVWIPLRLYMGIFRPRRPIIGMEFSGVVEEVGKNVTQFKPGDEVFAGTGPRFGTYAEYRCQSQHSAIARKPPTVNHGDAATISVGGLNALHYLRSGSVQAGDELLIVGGAGCFGTYAIQLAKHMGATVTAIDSTDKLDAMRELGADRVIDYTREDFTMRKERYDVILEIAGKSSYSRCLRVLTPKGRLILANPKCLQMLRAGWTSRFTSKTVSFAFSKDKTEDLEHVAQLIQDGTIKVVIDRVYPLEQLVEAHRYVETGAKIGQVVIQVAHEADDTAD
ncbi:MAG: NAD(P)-dependent alcohol dehydrogenase [Pirellulales bacterium]|nr:NAD(P)-dependent alcohol dehydrogenase [Pirellulales bacterium]